MAAAVVVAAAVETVVAVAAIEEMAAAAALNGPHFRSASAFAFASFPVHVYGTRPGAEDWQGGGPWPSRATSWSIRTALPCGLASARHFARADPQSRNS